MPRYLNFWFIALARGILALAIGSAVLIIPDMARSILLLPMAVTFSTLMLAVYGVLDSTLVFASSLMSRSKQATTVLQVQGALGFLVGMMFFIVIYERVKPEWFLLLAAIQAFCAGAVEIAVAQYMKRRERTMWSFGAAVIAFCFSATYLLLFKFSDDLPLSTLFKYVYVYLLSFGSFQCITAFESLEGPRCYRFLEWFRPVQRD